MDPQLTQVLAKMTAWLNLLTIVSITGFALLAGGLIVSNIALNRTASAIAHTYARRTCGTGNRP